MYKRDYHPDTDLIFKTKNYSFDSPKSVPLEPLSNALVQIDTALKKEETERIAEDVRINARVDKEITDRENTDIFISNRLTEYMVEMGSATRNLTDANNAIGSRRNVHSCVYGVGHYISVVSIRGEFKGTVNISLAEIGLKKSTTTSGHYNTNIQGTLISTVRSNIDNSKLCNIAVRANQTLFEVRTNISIDDDFKYFATTFIIERNIV